MDRDTITGTGEDPGYPTIPEEDVDNNGADDKPMRTIVRTVRVLLQV
jgi:hypothetical protein